MAERDYIISEERHRNRTRCRVCGESVYNGASFYTDGYQTVHMDCYFDDMGGDNNE